MCVATCWNLADGDTFQHTRATHCNTLQHTATHCNTLQHTATHCNTTGRWRNGHDSIWGEGICQICAGKFLQSLLATQFFFFKWLWSWLCRYTYTHTHTHTHMHTRAHAHTHIYYQYCLQYRPLCTCKKVRRCMCRCCSVLQCVAVWCTVSVQPSVHVQVGASMSMFASVSACVSASLSMSIPVSMSVSMSVSVAVAVVVSVSVSVSVSVPVPVSVSVLVSVSVSVNWFVGRWTCMFLHGLYRNHSPLPSHCFSSPLSSLLSFFSLQHALPLPPLIPTFPYLHRSHFMYVCCIDCRDRCMLRRFIMHMCDVTLSNVWHDSLIYDLTRRYAWWSLLNCVMTVTWLTHIWLDHMCHVALRICDMTRS